MSRFSFCRFYIVVIIFSIICPNSFSQQRQNDFTKRVSSLDGKLNIMSSKRLSSSRINGISTQRFSVNQWPSKFSPFGGKRYPMQNKELMGSERVKTSNLPNELSENQKFAPQNFKRVMSAQTENTSPAVASVEFRDAYYAQLDKRVDEWMDKVNNMSLRDINRFQFREGRPKEPGFPVQKAGSEQLPMSSSEQRLGASNVRGVLPTQQNRPSANLPKYWLGPKKVVSSTKQGKVSPTRPAPSFSSPLKKNSSFPQPVLGPKKIRVKVK